MHWRYAVSQCTPWDSKRVDTTPQNVHSPVWIKELWDIDDMPKPLGRCVLQLAQIRWHTLRSALCITASPETREHGTSIDHLVRHTYSHSVERKLKHVIKFYQQIAFRKLFWLGVAAHNFNPSIWGRDRKISLNWVWSTDQVLGQPELHSQILS